MVLFVACYGACFCIVSHSVCLKGEGVKKVRSTDPHRI